MVSEPERAEARGAQAAACDGAPAGGGTRQSWQVVAMLFVATTLIESMCWWHIFPFLPLQLGQLGVAKDQIPHVTSILSGLMFVVGLPLVPFWGVWADRYSRKVVIVRSALVEAGVFTLLATSRSPFQLGAAMLLVGLQLGNTGVMLAALRQAAPAHRVGLALSLISLAGTVGSAAGPALGGWLVDRAGFSLAGLYGLDAALSLGSAAMLALCYREARPSVIPEGASWALAWRSVEGVFREPVARSIFSVMAVFLVGRCMAIPLIGLVVERVHPAREGLASAIGMVTGTAALLGSLVSPLAGHAGDRLGHRRILAAGISLGGLALAAMALATDVVGLAILFALLAASVATVTSMVYALLAIELPEDRRSATLNLAFVPFYTGGLLGPYLAAAIVPHGLPFLLVVSGLVAWGALIPLAGRRPGVAGSDRPAAPAVSATA